MRSGRIYATVIVLSILVGGCRAKPTPEVRPADLVLHGGKVATVDDNDSIVQAVAMAAGRIVAVGSDDEIDRFIGEGTEVVDLGGRLVVPGFIEGHGHFMGLGDAKLVLDLTTAQRFDDIVDLVAEAAAEAQPGEWIRGRGWHQEKWRTPPEVTVEGNPVHESLSRVSPENPVLLEHASGHAAFANRKAMDLAGITEQTPDPSGGEIVRDGSGRATGLLRETAQRLVAEAMAKTLDQRSDEERRAEDLERVRLAGDEALSKGVTSFHDAGASFETIDFFRQLEQAGELPIRLYVMVRFADNDEMQEKLPRYRSESEGDDYLVVRSIKRQIDGALGAHGAWLLSPYEDLPTSVGLVLESEEEIRRTADLALEYGYQLNTHAIGDRANRVVLDIYQSALEAAGNPPDHRFRIEHAQHLHPDDVPRFAELGVIASMQGIHCTSDGPWVFRRLGSERARSGAYMWRSLIDSGAVVTNGTDVPVEDIDPIASYYASVARVLDDGSVFFGEQRMTREEALRSYTINNAFAAFEEGQKGSIEIGKLADLAVLSQDILTVPEQEIPATRVDLTILGGAIRYRRPDQEDDSD